nr:MAG TPA: hypothetical protein [Caudoviricetes sp.]
MAGVKRVLAYSGYFFCLFFQFCCCRFTPGKEGSSNEDSL